MTENKDTFRKALLKNRKSCPAKDEVIYNKLVLTQQFINADLILTYVSYRDEIDTRELLRHCFETKKSVAVPKTIGNNLIFKLIEDFDDLEHGFFGISEPKEYCKDITDFHSSLCIVPALAYNKSNHRIGYGKGFYDRFLGNYTGFSVGLCYKDNIREIPYDDFDVPVDFVITD